MTWILAQVTTGGTSNGKAELIISVISGVIVATVIAVASAAKRYARKELVDPVREIRENVAKEKDKRRAFQKKIVKRMDAYEAKAEHERQAQILERTRVQHPRGEDGRT